VTRQLYTGRAARPDAEQAEKLFGVFGGQLGGPMELLAPWMGENLGVERARSRPSCGLLGPLGERICERERDRGEQRIEQGDARLSLR
jgi:hypothetical protein